MIPKKLYAKADHFRRRQVYAALWQELTKCNYDGCKIEEAKGAGSKKIEFEKARSGCYAVAMEGEVT